MKTSLPLLALTSLFAGCIAVADAQPRRPPRRPRTPVAAPVAPAPTPTPAPAPSDGPRDVRYVQQRAQGTWQAQCVATRGCVAPREVPVCPPPPPNVRMMPPMSFAEVIDQRLRLDGQTVRVRGRLEGGGACTEMGCLNTPAGNFCCNHCGGAMALTGQANSSLRALGLGVENDPAFACTGDDSGLCCGTAMPTGDVVVTGTLRLVPRTGGAYRIESPTLCRPAS
jgi:hypothetical protein